MWDAVIAVVAIVSIGIGVGLMSIPWSLIVVGSIVLALTICGGLMKGPNK